LYTILTTNSFLRTAQKFFKRHPELKTRFKSIVNKLREDPTNPALNLHALKGPLTGLSAIRMTYKYRITIIIRLKQKEVILIDIR
jgi:mRNA-degrading endonuclease YafQ of YafQ-DinJ toxin-antitoxin module